MRIISGYNRGRILKTPSTKFTRPTTDKAKGVIFNYLNNLIDFDEISVCDIYAGSGALGLEALSRGAATVHFVEKNFPVITVLKENIKTVGEEECTRIFKMDALKFSKIAEHDSYDLIIADPPFFMDDIHKVAENLLERNYLKNEGRFLIERSVQTEKEDRVGFGIDPFKKIGDSLLYEFVKT
ncbi:MAG: 16S rRNA (guanine(966)-N(2))-methyltransferase RsmD [Bacteroidetes bacterium]|nr:16S rRNA (guanine(966)-N(2))-methyltransferase RsmD [Bacteroidota bacterium]